MISAVRVPGAVVLIATLLATQVASAEVITGLPQIQQALIQDADADMRAPLRTLAERGDRSAMRMLADLQAQSENPKDILAAIIGYRQSFANGQGYLTSLAAMAQIADRVPLFRPPILEILTDALPWVDLDRDPASVQAALDILLVFPDLISANDWQQLLALHQRGCLEDCHYTVYVGRHLESQGQIDAARQHYLQSMKDYAPAVGLFQSSFGDDDDLRHQVMLAYAAEQLGNLGNHTPETVASIAMALSRDAESYDVTITAWLDAAVENGSMDARVARIQMMMRLPGVFSIDDTLSEIEVVAVTHPTESQFLTAEAYMVRDWLSLDPFRARDILFSLEASYPMRVGLALGDLYTMGALDEPQPEQAIQLYQRLILEYLSTAAYQRIAGLYAGTPAFCNDQAAAWAYGQAALRLGQGGVRRLLSELASTISEEQREQGELMAAELMTALEARL